MIALGQKGGDSKQVKYEYVKKDRVELEGENKKQGGRMRRRRTVNLASIGIGEGIVGLKHITGLEIVRYHTYARGAHTDIYQ